MSLRSLRAATLAGVSIALFSTAAFAEVEIVTVTAEKRAENIQTVPIAVTAISASQLKSGQVRDFNDLQQLAPSLLVSTGSGDTAGGLVRIRGVGTTGNNAGLEASVGVFVDGVYRNRSAAALEDLLAVERVEVLRGPQGTLFGKNTTAGAISIISRTPTHDTYADFRALGGTLGTYLVSGEVGTGLTDDLAVDLAGSVSGHSGYLTDINDGHHSNAKSHYALKGQALWNPTPDLAVRVIADYTQKADSGSDAPFALYSTRTRLLQDVVQSPLSENFGRNFQLPVTLPQTGGALQDANYKRYIISSNLARQADVNDWGISGQVDWNTPLGATITSITAYRDFHSRDAVDNDYTPADLIFVTNSTGGNSSFTEELQLKGSWNAIDYLFGGFYSDERIKVTAPLFWGSDAGLFLAKLLNPAGAVGSAAGPFADVQACILGQANTNIRCAANGLSGVHTPLYQSGDGYIDHFSTQGDTFSIFTHDTWHVTDDVSVTLGARYNNERKHGIFDGGQIVWHSAAALATICGDPATGAGGLRSNSGVTFFAGFQALCARQAYNVVTSGEALTGTANVDWKVSDDVFLYASYSRGYKTQPINLNREATNTGAVIAKPEYDDNIEVGVKSTLFDGRVVANLTLFHERFRDFQINTFNGLNFAVANFRHAYADGFELETQAQPIDGLDLNFSATYADSRYGHDLGPTPGFPNSAPVQLAGATLTQAPLWTLNGGGTYTHPVGFFETLGFVHLDVNYRSKYNTGSDLNPNKLQPDFAIVNGQIGVRAGDDVWEVALWGRNLFNEHYNIVAFNTPFEQPSGTPSIASAISVFPGEPATFGISLTGHL